MYKTLSPYAIGVHTANLKENFAAAKIGGFEGVELPIQEIAGLVESKGAGATTSLFTEVGLRAAAWGLTVEWRQSEDAWRAGLEELPRLARASSAVGCKRVSTWVLSGSNDREYAENYEFHIKRFTPIAKILADNGCSLGLEFIGPKTMIDGYKYPFIRKMEDMLSLGREIGPNVGVLLDCWHWYTSGGTVEDLQALTPEQVVYVHVNDAPSGVDIDDQIDNVRALPGETGVIDIASFLRALSRIGYDGPVTPEPFKKELDGLPSDADRLRTVGAAMDKIFAAAGIAANE